MKIVGTKGRELILGAVLGGVAAAAGAPVVAEEAGCPVKGGALTLARTADVSGWYYQSNNPTIWAWPLVSLSLVRNKIDASGLEGAAAESWEASPDSKKFTFHLRKGLKFSDGSPVTSADVVDSFNASLADPQNVQQGIWPKDTKFSAPDDTTFVIEIPETQPAFVDNVLSQVGIYPKGSKPA